MTLYRGTFSLFLPKQILWKFDELPNWIEEGKQHFPCLELGFTGSSLLFPQWLTQGGIIFWLRGSLRDLPAISPEIALIKHNDNNQKSFNKAYFLKLPVNYPYQQEFILIDRKIRQQIQWKCKMHKFQQGFLVRFNDFLVTWFTCYLLKSCPVNAEES